MTSNELRKKFIKFFEEKGHKYIPSASLVPENDPSVLFTTAGMQQFKKWFSGEVKPKYPRVVTIQKCVRTSDIDEVGDETHLTFFEMLGNFSFGDYWKQEAIDYAWKLLTSKQWLGIDKKRIHATYFDQKKVKETGSPAHNFESDTESLEILKSIKGLQKIESQGEDNFWTLGSPGSPGGPTVEFYVDNVEVWNLVFNEAIWKGDHWFFDNVTKGVDTGMGLERLAAVLNRFNNVYDTDELNRIIHIVSPIIGEIKEGEKIKEYPIVERTRGERIIVDHLRATTFLLADGVKPSNLGKGYILRRLIRRAITKYVIVPGVNEKEICSSVAEEIIRVYKDIYRNLSVNKEEIINEFNREEGKFRKTLKKGFGYLSKQLERISKFDESKEILTGKKGYSFKDLGKLAFDMFQNYGFPLEMTKELIDEKLALGMKVDHILLEKSFNEEYANHQELSRKGAEKKFKGGLVVDGEQETKHHTATHLLQQALRDVLGNHVKQKGSNITAERLRFDFSHHQKMTPEEIKKTEDIINQKIKEKLQVKSEEMSYDEAIKKGAIVVYSKDRYPEKVTVYSINNYSKEICGGPHIKNTSELGHFKIKKEEASSAGVRRIKAILE